MSDSRDRKGWLEKNLEDNEFCRALIKEQDEEIKRLRGVLDVVNKAITRGILLNNRTHQVLLAAHLKIEDPSKEVNIKPSLAEVYERSDDKRAYKIAETASKLRAENTQLREGLEKAYYAMEDADAVLYGLCDDDDWGDDLRREQQRVAEIYADLNLIRQSLNPTLAEGKKEGGEE